MPINVTYAKTTTAVVQPNNHAPNPRRIDPTSPFEGKPEPTILIIGAGTFGTSAAYHLAEIYQDASKVTVLDQASSPPKPAASVDANRVIRTDYANKLYCDLACETIHPWFWSEELGPHFHKVGWLMLEERGSDLQARIRSTLAARGSTQTRDVALAALADEWPALRDTDTSDFQDAYFNPEAGWCDAAAATHSFMRAAQRKGVRRETGRVVELLYDDEAKPPQLTGARTADGRVFRADHIILAAGAWTSALLSPLEERLGLPPPLRVESQIQATGLVAAYYRCDDAAALHRAPVVVYGGIGEVIPPAPASTGTTPLMKYANSRSGIVHSRPCVPGSAHSISVPADQHVVPECLKRETLALIADKVAPRFTRGKEPDSWRICWDAQSPTEDFLICRHPDARLRARLTLATGGSFHGYKFLPIIGKYILNVLNDISNGEEKDRAWGWKSPTDKWVDVHERGLLSHKSVTKTELSELFERDGGSKVQGPRL